MSAPALRVAIVGGGIGGTAAANALLQRGLNVRVYEQASALSEVGAGVASVKKDGMLVSQVVIPFAHKALVATLTS